jgi:hypothetical protein
MACRRPPLLPQPEGSGNRSFLYCRTTYRLARARIGGLPKTMSPSACLSGPSTSQYRYMANQVGPRTHANAAYSYPRGEV